MSRYIPNTDEDRAQMLAEIGISDIGELFADIPEEMRQDKALNLPDSLSEQELATFMRKLAGRNAHCEETTCFLGAGAYDHYVPAIVSYVTSKPEFYTAYTPYQAEISQGMLQAIFEYQTMICNLTGMDVSNASMYDGATAMAEAALMAVRFTGRKKVLVSRGVHPEYREVLRTYAKFNEIEVEEIALSGLKTDMAALAVSMAKFDTAAVIVQNPNFFGYIEDLKGISEFAASKKTLSVACVDPISLGILQPPGKCGADIVVGDGQSLGNPLYFGGPTLGFLAAKKEFLRKMPGRIVGQTTDGEGRRGFVLTLQAREQHIRREKAVSNICSNQALNALAATVYMSVMGPDGFREIADLCLQKSHYALDRMLATGKFERASNAPFVKEFAVKALNEPVAHINERLLKHNIIGGFELGKAYPELKDYWLIAVTEKRTKHEIDEMVRIAAGGDR